VDKDVFEIIVTENFDAKQVLISMVNGGIDVTQENVSFSPGDIIKVMSISNSSEKKFLNITLENSSTIMDVPSTSISYKKEAAKNASRGCGGCGRGRR
tara:strand:- start:1724 stop:2017 length:294 start_codon:yes stop_codon:yes gene_type:complete